MQAALENLESSRRNQGKRATPAVRDRCLSKLRLAADFDVRCLVRAHCNAIAAGGYSSAVVARAGFDVTSARRTAFASSTAGTTATLSPKR